MRHFFFDDPFAVARHVRKNCPEEARAVIRAADDVTAQRFLFALRWDMERTHEPVIFDGDIDWLHQPGDDPEWVYAFNRMRFFICLGQAYALTADEKYAKTFVRQLCHWILTVRPDDPACEKAWRSIEVGLRLEYWLKAMQYFQKSEAVAGEASKLFFQSVSEHAEKIMGIWDSYNLMSNWGVLANHGLFIAGVMLPPSRRTEAYTKEALRRLWLELRMQVYRDGSHWEQSPMYHNEVLHCLLDVLLLAQRNGIALPEGFSGSVRAMCRMDIYAGKPNHREICMGDSDDIDQRDLITRGAVIFSDGEMKARGYELPDFDTAWEIGERGIDALFALPAVPPKQTDFFAQDSGNAYLRGGWGERDTFVHFACGPLGAGHGHADKLHVDVFSRGEDLLVDAGRYTYVFGPGRIAYKEMRAHNTLMVDGRELYALQDSWECAPLSRGVNQRFFSNGRYAYAEGGHIGYMADGVYVNRRVIFLKPDIVVLADELYAHGSHLYNQFFHFNNSGKVIREGDDSYRYESAALTAQVRLIASGLSSKVFDTRISRQYNREEAALGVETAFTADGFASAFTVIAMGDAGRAPSLRVEKVAVRSSFKGIAFEDKQAEALTIRLGAKRYTLVIAHEEYASPTDTFLADGCTGFGNAVVFDRAAGETEIGAVLLW